jgi:hypothetical protein
VPESGVAVREEKPKREAFFEKSHRNRSNSSVALRRQVVRKAKVKHDSDNRPWKVWRRPNMLELCCAAQPVGRGGGGEGRVTGFVFDADVWRQDAKKLATLRSTERAEKLEHGIRKISA